MATAVCLPDTAAATIAAADNRLPAFDVADTRAKVLSNEAMSPLFEAVAEATEEAIVNSLFRAGTMAGHRGTVPALPLERVLPLLEGSGVRRPGTR